MRLKRAIPSWVIGLVIIVTAVFTLIAVVKTQSAVSWTPQGAPESPKSFGQIFFPGIAAIQQSWASAQAAAPAAPAPTGASPSRVPTIVAGTAPGHTNRGTCTGCHNVLTPRGAAMPSIQLGSRPPHDDRGLCTNCHTLATPPSVVAQAGSGPGGATKVPTIVAGAVPIHSERGPCASCHEVVSSRGIPVPSIQVNSRRPHDNRGLCTNCHSIGSATPPAALAQGATTPAALTMVATAMPMAQPTQPTLGLPAAQPAMPAAEGGWNGIEVTPVTALTANQYGIPHGTVGLIVAEAEGGAAVAGIKAGDVLLGVNGTPTPTLADFFKATGNGMVARGSVDLLRKGVRSTVVVDAAATAAQVVPAPQPTPQSTPLPVAQTVAAAMATPPAATAPAPPEGEWLGLEVAPISSITTTQYNLPPGLSGLIIVEAEAQAATIGVKAGDVLQYVNGVPTTDITRFFLATKNGTLTRGTIVLWRKGEQMVNVLGQTVTAPGQPAASAPPVTPAAQVSPYGQLPLYSAPYGQTAWPGATPVAIPTAPAGYAGPGTGAGTGVPCYRQF